MRRALASLAFLALLACNNPTEPVIEIPRGRLFGVVTIGPNCPGPQGPQECPTPPSAYRERKILIYNADRSRLLFTVDIDTTGAYLIDLPPASYIADLRGVGIDRTSDLPATVQIRANQSTRLDVRIDTGLR